MQNSNDSPTGPDDRDGPGVDPTEATFQDWIDHVADAEGVPPKAVRARLMSSYWILDELAQHLEDASFEELTNELADEEFTAALSDEDGDRVRTILEELVEDARSMETSQLRDPEQASWERLVEMVESLDGFAQGEDDDQPTTATESPESTRALGQLDRTVRELTEQVDAMQRRWSERHDRLSDRVDDIDRTVEHSAEASELDAIEGAVQDRLSEVEAALETIEAALENESDRLDGALSEQADELSDLDDRLGSQAERIQTLQETLSGLAEELQAIRGEVGTNRDRLEAAESTIDANGTTVKELQQSVATHESELENAEKIFRHLFNELDRLNEYTAGLRRGLQDLEPVLAAHHEREQVDSLKEAAAELGSRTATCETCEQTVDIGLLTEPACPHCETPAARVVSRTGLLRSKTVLESAEHADEFDRDLAAELPELDTQESPMEQGSADPASDSGV